MDARTKTVGTKVTPAVYEALNQRAHEQGKTVADVMREMIEGGLDKESSVTQQEPSEVIGRIDALEQMIVFHHNALGELLLKAVKASAGAQYFARLSTNYAQDLTSFVSSQQPLDSKTKKDQMNHFNLKSREFEEQLLRASFEQVV